MKQDGIIRGGQDRTSGEIGELVETMAWLFIYGGVIGICALVVRALRSLAGA